MSMKNGDRPSSNAKFTTTTLSDTAVPVFAAVAGSTGGDEINAIMLLGGAAAEIVIFRAVDDTPEYFRVPLAIGEFRLLELPMVFPRSEGLEVVTASPAGDVQVHVFFWKPGAAGIGV